jgi:hypothetical protein
MAFQLTPSGRASAGIVFDRFTIAPVAKEGALHGAAELYVWHRSPRIIKIGV